MPPKAYLVQRDFPAAACRPFADAASITLARNASGATVMEIDTTIGPEHFTLMEHGLRYWMARHERDSIEAFRGLTSLHHGKDLGYFARIRPS